MMSLMVGLVVLVGGQMALTQEQRVGIMTRCKFTQIGGGQVMLGDGTSGAFRHPGLIHGGGCVDTSDLVGQPMAFSYGIKGKIRRTLDNGCMILSAYGVSEYHTAYFSKNYLIYHPKTNRVFPDDTEIEMGAAFVRTGNVANLNLYGRIEVIEMIDIADNVDWKAAYDSALSIKAKRAKEQAKFESEMAENDRRQKEIAKKIGAEKAARDAIASLKSEVTATVAAMDKSCANLAKAENDMQAGFSVNAIRRHIDKLEKSKAKAPKLGMTDADVKDLTAKADAAIALGKATLGKGGAR